MLIISILTSSLFTATVIGKIISVDVGKDGLVYNPDTIVAAVGDQIQFVFYPIVSRIFAGFPHADPSFCSITTSLGLG
jgi:hypothetical protein